MKDDKGVGRNRVKKVSAPPSSVRSAIAALGQFIKELAIKSWQNSMESHRRNLKKRENQGRLAMGVLLFILFFLQLLDSDVKLAASFMFAGGMALYTGTIYKGREVMGFVLVGVVLAATLPNMLIPGIRESFAQGNYIGMVVLIGLGIYIFYWSSTLKKGEIPSDWAAQDKPKTRRRRAK
jgi:hypothetical protein